MLRRALTLALAALLALAVVPPVAASPTCGPYTELQAFDGNFQAGLNLGFDCGGPFTTDGQDGNWGDASFAYRSTDTNRMNSWKFWNPTPDVWCLVFYDATGFGTGAGYIYYALGPTATWWGPAPGHVGDFTNRASSHKMWKRGPGGCAP